MLSMQFAVRFSRFLRAYKTVLILLASTTGHGAECLPHCCTQFSSDWQSHINFNLIQLALSSGICRLRHLLSLIAKQRGCREYKHIACQTENVREGAEIRVEGGSRNALKQHLSCLFTRSLEEKLDDLICSMGPVCRV